MHARPIINSARVVLALVLLPVLIRAIPSAAAEPTPRWHARDTASFRILNYGLRPLDSATAAACERERAALARRWFGRESAPWNPKCDLVLHSTDAAYLREVGSGGAATSASALVERRAGRIVLRRIDIRATQADWQSAALGHELAHVVLADRFADAPLPRWLDEGMAILADGHHKRASHQRTLERALARGAQFRVAELLALEDYPAPERWGTFYGQSASLVAYLVNQRGHARFVEFVELSLDHGYEAALARVYRCGIAELERRWHRHVAAPAASAASPASPRRAEVTTSAG